MKESEIKYYYDIEQGTEEWLGLRLGVITASRIKDLITPKGKIADNKTVRDYAYELAIQREVRFIEDCYQSFDMQRGQLQEVIARDRYSEVITPVKECGFIIREFDGFKIGASPDGLINNNGGIEIKSRLSKFQIKTIIEDEVPVEYIDQIQCCLLVTGHEWWDFVQYSNGLPLYVKRVYPDLDRQSLILEAVEKLEERVVAIQSVYKARAKKMIPCEWVDFMSNDEITGS